MRISRLVYISERNAGIPLNIAGLIQKSRRNNANAGVTGFLISDGDYFAQLLEGSRSAVTDTYNRIAGDPRHHRLHIVSCMDVKRRLFPHWAMGLLDGIPLEARKALLSNFNIECFDQNTIPVERLLPFFAMMAAHTKAREQSAMVLMLPAWQVKPSPAPVQRMAGRS